MNRWERSIAWFAGAALATAAVAWIAFQLGQQQIAPAVLFPLATGSVLALALLALLRWTAAPSAHTARLAAIVWGLLAVVTQDYIGHVEWLRDFEAQLRQQPLAIAAAEDLRPTLAEHVSGRIRARPVWWALDLVLTAAAAGLVTTLGTRKSHPATPIAAESSLA